jgi:outer membrane cobalamin receptor
VPTNSDGRFGPLTLAPGEYEVVVSASGLRLAPQHLIAGADAIDLTLKLELAAIGESVVVSSAQADTVTTRATGSVTVIDRETLDDLQVDTVADALHQTPGFSVITSGGRGAVTSLFPRGGESDYTLVLVDGIEQNAFGGAFDAAHLVTSAVDRIEVVRGPQSALYGAGAIGGIVQVFTANGGALRGSAQVEGGSFGTTAASGSFSGSGGAWTFGAGVDWLESDGVTDVVNGYAVTNDDYSRASFSGSLGWSDAPARRVRVDVRRGRNERGYPGPYGSDPLGLYSGIDTISRGVNKDTAVGVVAKFGQKSVLSHSAHLNWVRWTSTFASPFGDSEVETSRATGRYQLDWNHSRSPVSTGVEWSGEQEDNAYITDEAFQPVPVQRSTAGFFAELRPSFGDRVFATVGVRTDRIERKSLESDGFGRPPFDDQALWSTNPKFAVTWLASEGHTGSTVLGWTKVRFGAGSGIKAPTAFEIAFTNNPDLKPERSRSVDIGIEQAFASSKVVADATWFYNSYDDLIISVGTSLAGASRYRTDNIANARARGLELGATWHPVLALSIRAAWNWLDTEVLDVDSLSGAVPPPYVPGDSLIRRPASSGSLDVRWNHERFSAYAAISGRGSMLDLEPNFGSSTVNNPGFATTAFGGTVQVHRAVGVYARLTNAFDQYYEDAFGYPALGRSVSVGIRVGSGR